MTRRLGVAVAVLGCAVVSAVAVLASGDGDGQRGRPQPSSTGARPRSSAIDAPRLPAGLARAQALVTIHGLTAPATVETYCARSSREAYCVDAVLIASDSAALPAAPAARAGVLLGHRARGVSATMARLVSGGAPQPIGGSLAVTQRSRGGRRWAIALPADELPEGAVLRFGVAYSDYRVDGGKRVFFDIRVEGTP